MADESERKPFNARCGACAHVWAVAYTPIGLGVLANVLITAHCPMCGESSKNIYPDEGSEHG